MNEKDIPKPSELEDVENWLLQAIEKPNPFYYKTQQLCEVKRHVEIGLNLWPDEVAPEVKEQLDKALKTLSSRISQRFDLLKATIWGGLDNNEFLKTLALVRTLRKEQDDRAKPKRKNHSK